MRPIIVGAAALNQTPKDWSGNASRIREAIGQAKEQGVELLVLPELSITGYGCEDLFFQPWLAKRAWRVLEELATECTGIAVTLGLPVLYKRKLYNCIAMVVDRKILGLFAKQNLPGDGIHYEPRWFKEWKGGFVGSIRRGGLEVPIGDLTFEINGVKVGVEICEDAWVSDRPGRALSNRAVDLIVNPSASHFAFGKYEVRTKFVEEASRAFNVVYVYANLLGNEAGRAIYDGDCLIATCGQVLSRSKRFSYKPVTLTTAVVNVDAVRMNAQRITSFEPDLEDDRNCRFASFELAKQPGALTREDDGKSKLEAWENSEQFPKKCEEFTRAVSLGLWDYLRKSRMFGYMVSLSGGADSGGTCVLVDSMVKLAQLELGTSGFLTNLSYIEGLTEENHRGCLLQTVYLPTKNSGKATLNSARVIAGLCGAKFKVEDVSDIYASNRAAIQDYIGRELTWESDDIALQNLGARSRPTVPWGIANVNRLLFLNTSNRSEAAVGYCTMDGDTSGAINPIGGIDKEFLLKWLVWMEKVGPSGLSALPELAVLNSLQPTAELRPLEAVQTDEADLMPYPVLNRIEHLFAVEGYCPVEIYTVLREEVSHHGAAPIKAWIRKFFNLCQRAQWKRERLALSFHVDDHNLDPRTWFRFPILTASFEEELAEMDVV